jgi:drug/metabolite transporter superfamily protein YnfA
MYTHAILLSIVGIFAVKDRLKEKKALSFTILSILLALVVIIADTEMAGLLNRYYMDFLWLLVLPAVIVLAQTLTSFRGRTMYRYAGWFIIFAGISGCVCEIMTGIDAGELVKNNIYRFYMLKSLFG